MTIEPEMESEGPSEIVVAIIDETYDNGEGDDEQASAVCKSCLVDEFTVEFREADIGPGGRLARVHNCSERKCVPTFALAHSGLFSSRPVVDNLAAWRQIFASVQKYFSRPLVLGRDGAAALAVEAVFTEME